MDDTESLTLDPDFEAWLDARAAEYLMHLDTSPEALDEALVDTLATLTSVPAEVSA